MGCLIKKPGICTTVQDRGRIGYMGSGFAPSGVMDHRAMTIANLLVENSPDDCVLEFVLTGPIMRFTTNTVIALTGGNFGAKLNGKPIPMYQAVPVQHGSILDLGPCRQGVFGYLAIAGGSFDIPEIMGSKSTNLKCGLGGFKGRPLSAGDYLPFTTRNLDFITHLESHRMPKDTFYSETMVKNEEDKNVQTLRIIPGPQENFFTQRGIKDFYSKTFSTSNKCDRMGFRLDGPIIETKHGSDIVSDGIAFGAVQIPSHGRPIIMLADRQTTGGYAKIGTVASVDIPRLVQCPVNTEIRFKPISVQEAQALIHKEAFDFQKLGKKFKLPCSGGVSPRRTARKLTPILEHQARISQGEQLWIADNPDKE